MKPTTFHGVLTSLDHTDWDTVYHSQWAHHTEKSNTIAHYVVADEPGPLRSQRLIKLALMEPSMFYQSNDLGVSPIEALTGNGPQLFEMGTKSLLFFDVGTKSLLFFEIGQSPMTPGTWGRCPH